MGFNLRTHFYNDILRELSLSLGHRIHCNVRSLLLFLITYLGHSPLIVPQDSLQCPFLALVLYHLSGTLSSHCATGFITMSVPCSCSLSLIWDTLLSLCHRIHYNVRSLLLFFITYLGHSPYHCLIFYHRPNR